MLRNVLKTKAEEAKVEGKEIYACLVFDEMAIRKHSQWDNSKKQFIGHITVGMSSIDNEALPLAKETLVFMITGLNEDFKVPIGYFLITGLKSQEKSVLISEAIYRVGEVGVKVVAVTFDGLATNLA